MSPVVIRFLMVPKLSETDCKVPDCESLASMITPTIPVSDTTKQPSKGLPPNPRTEGATLK